MNSIEKISKGGLINGLLVYLIIGIILSVFLSSIIQNNIIQYLLTIVTVIIGFKTDFKEIDRTEIVSVVNSLTKKAEYNATGTYIWTMFGLLYIDEIYDNTQITSSFKIENGVTSDGNIIQADVDLTWKINNAIKIDEIVGSSDFSDLLIKKVKDAVEGHIKITSLKQIEQTVDNVELGNTIKILLGNFFANRGAEFIQIDLRNIKTSAAFDKARELRQLTKLEQANKKVINDELKKRAKEDYLAVLEKSVEGLSYDEIIALAESSLNINFEDNQIKVINKAVSIAEEKSGIETLELIKLYNESYNRLQVNEGITPLQRFEGLEGATPLIGGLGK